MDGRLRTSVAGVYAIGDLVPGPALAHKASDEGIIAVEDAAGRDVAPDRVLRTSPAPRSARPTSPPSGSPRSRRASRASTSWSASSSTARSAPARCTATAPAWSRSSARRSTASCIGGHIVGAKATDLIQELVNAKALEGGYSEVARIVHGHPTFSEAVMEAARAADGWLIHG